MSDVTLTDYERTLLCQAQGCDAMCHCARHIPLIEEIIGARLEPSEANADHWVGRAQTLASAFAAAVKRSEAAEARLSTIAWLTYEWDARLLAEHPGVDPDKYTDWHSREVRDVLGVEREAKPDHVEKVAELILRYLLAIYPTTDIHARHARAIAQGICERWPS